jgi:hypothetical protein
VTSALAAAAVAEDCRSRLPCCCAAAVTAALAAPAGGCTDGDRVVWLDGLVSWWSSAAGGLSAERDDRRRLRSWGVRAQFK